MRLFRSRPRVDVKGLPAEVATQLLKLLDDVERLPQDLRCRRALADCLRGIGRFEEAITHYQALAGAYAAQGLLFRAIAVCKTILELDPSHDETEATLARLYAQHDAQSEQALVELPASMGTALVIDDADTRDYVVEPGREYDPLAIRLATEASARFEAANHPEEAFSSSSMPPVPSDEVSVDDLEPIIELDADGDGDEILDDEILADLTPKASGSVGLKRPQAVPLFSSLSPARFTDLVKALRCWEAQPGAVIVVEGDPGDSVFVIARGSVVIERAGPQGPVELARLRAGEFFGEIAILAERPRAASVTALKKTELLEIDRSTLTALVARDPDVAAILEEFCTRRLIENTLQTSPLFDGLEQRGVLQVMERFEARAVVDGDALITQGASSDGLHILLSGTVDVMASTDVGGFTTTMRLKQLGPGDVFGEMGLLRGEPATASCIARGPARLAVLSAGAFAGLQADHPDLRTRLEALKDSRAAFNARFLPVDETSGARPAAV